ncbi:MAG: alpha-ribazole phosphatase [Microscillaceae bacterium]|nr:alpha-ribazole phosphatase [Microscillaceae bacterium]
MPHQTVYLLRHTTPAVEKGLIYGQTDLDVADSFAEEVAEIQKIVPHHRELPLYSSPLRRCQVLAETLRGNPLRFDERLKEMHFGQWEMKRWDEIEAEKRKYWLENIETASTPEGESNQALQKRSLEFWEELQSKNYAEVGLVTHYGVIQSLLAHLLHIPLAKAFRLDIGYGAVVRILIQEGQYYKIKFLR